MLRDKRRKKRERQKRERVVLLSDTVGLIGVFFVLYCFHGRRNPLESHNGGTVGEWDCHKASLPMNSIKTGCIKMGIPVFKRKNQIIFYIFIVNKSNEKRKTMN